MANWRLAESLKKLREQINAEFPGRSKASDGSVGDTSHSARASDHNPNDAGVVCAIDVTHDPRSGCTGDKLAAALIKSRDPRIKYLIFNRRIFKTYPSNGKPAWTWHAYTGANAHTKHIHISVSADKGLYDSKVMWDLDLDVAVIAQEAAGDDFPAGEGDSAFDAAIVARTQTSDPDDTPQQSPATASVTVMDGNVKVETSEGLKPVELVAIEKPPAKNFGSTIRNKITTVAGGNVTLAMVRDYAEQAKFLGLSLRFWFWITLIAGAATVIYLVAAFYRHRSDVARDLELTNSLIQANTTPSNRVELVDAEKVDEFKAKGFKIVRR
jgi:hypothetical protein